MNGMVKGIDTETQLLIGVGAAVAAGSDLGTGERLLRGRLAALLPPAPTTAAGSGTAAQAQAGGMVHARLTAAGGVEGAA